MENIFESIESNYNKLKEEYLALKSERIADAFVGYIYVLVNPLFDMVKIGYAKDVEKRMKELSGSSMPEPYHCYCTYGVTETRTDLEVHSLIDDLDPDLRHSANREFYDISKERAYRILSSIAKISGTTNRLVINPFNDNYFCTVEFVGVVEGKENIIKNNCDKNKNLHYGVYHNKEKTIFARFDKDGWTILKGTKCRDIPNEIFNYSSYHTAKKLYSDATRNNAINNGILMYDICLGDVSASYAIEWVDYLRCGCECWFDENEVQLQKIGDENHKEKPVYSYVCLPEGLYYNKQKTATIYTDGNDNWTILKGSFANTKSYTNPLTGKIYQDRWNHIKDNKFVEDVHLSGIKLSTIANYIENHGMNGWDYWYTEDGRTINEAFPRT